MDFPWHILLINIFVILPLAAVVGALVGPKHGKVETSVGAAAIVFWLSWVAWIVYIVLHFISKYW